MEFSYFLVVLNLVSCEGALRIIGGRDALRNEFPFAVRIEYKERKQNNGADNVPYSYLCTGTAVSSEWILTAAHCYTLFKGYEIIVRYNSHFPKEMGEISPVLEFYIHPHYVTNSRIEQNDIGLFRSRNIRISQYGRISAVDYRALLGHEVNILGFGATNATHSEKPLQVLNGMIKTCFEDEDDNIRVYSPMCIARSCSVKATICGGDSGGPIVHASGVIGVNSASADDCDEFTTDLKLTPGTSASIVATVSHSLDWISKVISNKTKY